MRSAPDIIVSDNMMPDVTLPKDDIDVLFDKLQSIEPPPSLISRILELSRNSSSMPLFSIPTLRNPWEELDSLALRNDKSNPC
jgi:uncharacterized UPF0146 family protein